MDNDKNEEPGNLLEQVDGVVPDPLKWVTKSIGINSKGDPVFMRGKHGPDWNYTKDPYASIGAELRLTNFYMHHEKFMVTEIFEECVEGYLIGEHYHRYPTPYTMKVPHDKYNSQWVRNVKRFVSDKPRLEVTSDGIKVWNTVRQVAVDHPEDFWADQHYIQRYLERQRCRSVSDGVARKPRKQAARKTIWNQIIRQNSKNNWGRMRKMVQYKTGHCTIKKKTHRW